MKAQAFLLSILPLTLAACGGGGSGDSTLNIDPRDTARTFAGTAGDFGDVMVADGTLTARQAAEVAINLDYALDTAAPTDATVAIKRNGDGEFTLIVNGTEHPFAPGDRTSDQIYFAQFGPNDRDGFFVVFNETLDDALSAGNGYVELFLYQTSFPNDGEPNIRGYAAIGTEMADGAVTTLGSATYSGFAFMDIFENTGFIDIETSRANIEGDATMTINLASTEISGVIDNMQYLLPGGSSKTAVAGTVTMNPAEFDVNAFGGSLTADADLIANVPFITEADVGTYSGAFFGPAGEEVGGALSYSDDEVTGAGFFYGAKD